MFELTAPFKDLLRRLNVAIVKHDTLQQLLEDRRQLEETTRAAENLRFILNLPARQIPLLVERLESSKAQLLQDLFVLSQLDFKRNGFFVEFGATNGVDLSNTHLLERAYGWNGILAEPAKCWHADLRANRKCQIEERCVWVDSRSTLSFRETESHHLSTIESFGSRDSHYAARNGGRVYQVETISLLDLLIEHDAPNEIDYLSIDTEGSEYEILRCFDFDRYRFKVITCEHNYTPIRENVFELLTARGYERRFQQFSRWDDWYVAI